MLTRLKFNKIWREMMEMQKALDKHMFERNGTNYEKLLHPEGQPYAQPYRLAILDELGELNHELKKEWCWWKQSQPPVDREKVLGELVDVLHFVLSWQIAERRWQEEDPGDPVVISRRYYECGYGYTVLDMAAGVADCRWSPVGYFMAVMRGLNFDLPEVYEAYKAKNAENHQRQNNGY